MSRTVRRPYGFATATLAGALVVSACFYAFWDASPSGASTPDSAVVLPTPPAEQTARGDQVAVLAGGCFWGLEGLYEHVKGVKSVTSGYAGGSSATANYRAVSSEKTGHAEAVRIVYDPAKVSYGTLLRIFFSAS